MNHVERGKTAKNDRDPLVIRVLVLVLRLAPERKRLVVRLAGRTGFNQMGVEMDDVARIVLETCSRTISARYQRASLGMNPIGQLLSAWTADILSACLFLAPPADAARRRHVRLQTTKNKEDSP
jgi:hypothetical protein